MRFMSDLYGSSERRSVAAISSEIFSGELDVEGPRIFEYGPALLQLSGIYQDPVNPEDNTLLGDKYKKVL